MLESNPNSPLEVHDKEKYESAYRYMAQTQEEEGVAAMVCSPDTAVNLELCKKMNIDMSRLLVFLPKDWSDHKKVSKLLVASNACHVFNM